MAIAPAGPALQSQLAEALLASRNTDGGWGYYPGKASRIEPTAWVALAGTEATTDALAWLRGTLDGDGWLRDDRRAPVNYGFNALALIAMLGGPAVPEGSERLARNLLGVRGLAFGPSPVVRQDNSLQAWSWVDGTLSWVEPTAYALLATKRARDRGLFPPSVSDERIDIGERMLADRACDGGGWNYGNAQVFDKRLIAHGPTTALALLGLQDRTDLPAAKAGVDFLVRHADAERSGLALALTTICLRVLQRDAGAASRAIPDQAAVSLHVANAVTIAALHAATSDDADALAPFTVTGA